MAKEIQVPWTATGQTLYAVVRNSVGLAWNGASFENYQTAHLASEYAITLTEQGSHSAYYAGNMPAVAAGYYNVVAYQQAGGSPAEGDPLAAAAGMDWTGTAVASVGAGVNATQVNGNATAAANLATAYGGFLIGTAQAGSASGITLPPAASSVNNFYANQSITILAGTGAGQTNKIVSNVGQVATVETPWATVPDATSVVAVLGRIG